VTIQGEERISEQDIIAMIKKIKPKQVTGHATNGEPVPKLTIKGNYNENIKFCHP
jgi:hypothetical protein